MNTKVALAALLCVGALIAAPSAVAAATLQELTPSGYPTDYRAISSSYFADALKDPDSAKIAEMRGPRWLIVGEKGLLRDGRIAGWSVCFKVNAKNSYGGYTGNHTYLLMIGAGKVIWSRQSPYYNNYAYREMEDQLVEGSCSLAAEDPPAGH